MTRRILLLLCVSNVMLQAADSIVIQKGEVVAAPRSATVPTRFVFPYVTTLYSDTEITISNTSQDTLGTSPQAGACTLSFYGSGVVPAAGTTVSIAAGNQLVFNLSQGGGGIAAAPGFQGYVAGSCAFPSARATAKISQPGAAFSETAQIVTTPRSTSTPQSLLFPFVSGVTGFDTGIIVANTSLDAFGTTPASGSCTLHFYGANAPPQIVTGTIAPGGMYVALASQVAPGFQGYAVATCTFPGVAGVGDFVDLGSRYFSASVETELLAAPRSTANGRLLFSSVINQSGFDTPLVIANTSSDPLGTTPVAGPCTLSFYGANAPAPYTTSSIAAGSVYSTTTSALAPGFNGYIVAACSFPDARGWTLTAPASLTGDGGSQSAEVLTTPRNATPTSLLFSSVTNRYGADTGITIANTSQDSLGTSPSSGMCTISYFGDMTGGGSTPAPQTSDTILAGGQLTFLISQGNPAQGIAGAPGFRGYVIADCTFPLARGTAFITSHPPVLGIAKSHTGNPLQGQTNFTYTVTVSNQAGAGTTDGTVTVTDTLPSGLTLVGMAGNGWSCPSNSCTRSDPLVGGASYDSITVTVNVNATAASPQVNSVRVSGGGSGTATITDSTTVVAVPALSVTKSHSGNFTKGQTNASYTVTVSNAASAGPTSGTVTVTENIPAGLILVSMAGNLWNCVNGGNTCSRTDPLAAGASYPAITVTVNAASDAPLYVTNQVAVSLGGVPVTSANDVTLVDTPPPPQYLISTYAGGIPTQTAATAASYPLGIVNAVAVDQFGDVYVSSYLNCVFKIDPSGIVTRVAGTCQAGYSGDGGSAINAQLNNPQGVAVDSAGNLYIADQFNYRIRRVSTKGIITTVAGTGGCCYSGDGGLATGAWLNSPQGVAVDAAGNLYIADTNNHRVRKVTADGNIATVAGNGTGGYTGDGVAALSAELNSPRSVAVDAAGNLYIADYSNNRVRFVGANGLIGTVAGTGAAGNSGDSGPATSALLNGPYGVAVDSTGNLYIADSSNNRVRKVAVNGTISAFAGTGFTCCSGYGDNGPAASAQLAFPQGVAMDSSGNLFIADSGNVRVRKVIPAGTISTLAGGVGNPFGGDGGPAALAQLTNPQGLAVDGAGGLYVVDASNCRVRKISAAGVISPFAGSGSCGDSGDGSAATSAGMAPNAMARDSAGNIYISGRARIRKISAGGVISTLAGTGTSGFSGDGGQATLAKISFTINGLAVDSTGNVYFSDQDNNRVRKVTPLGVISTVAGTGTAGYGGDGGQATSAQLNGPKALAVDAAGNLYIGDTYNYRVRKLALDGTIATVAGNGTYGGTGDGGLATAATLAYVGGLAVDSAGNLYISASRDTIRRVSPGGIITAIAGSNSAGYSGDGGPALSARLNYPAGTAVDSAGNLYLSDSGNNAVRLIQPVATAPLLTVAQTHSGNFTQGQMGATYSVTLNNAASVSTSGPVTVTETVPAGLTLISMAGSGWDCSTLGVCTSTGSSLQPITVTVNVAANAPPQVMPEVAVAGGGSPGAGAADLTVIGAPTAVLAIASAHAGTFIQGQSNATYSLTVGNQTAAASTSGAVTVAETLPSGLTPVSMAGSGWICGASSCTRSDPLGGGDSYPPIIVTVNVTATASSPQVNAASVSGGGSATANVTDSTTILPAPVLGITESHTGNFAQGQTNVTYTVTVSNGASAGATSGTVTVTETIPGGMTLVSMAGSGWNCPSPGNTCTRNDVLNPGANYAAITVTVSVAANASTPQVNSVSVSGGGSITATATDSTVITPAPSINAVINSASLTATGLAPGEAMSIFGANLSNSSTLVNCITALPAPVVCGGTSVLINGNAVPLLVASATQVNIQVPFGITGSSATVQVNSQGALSSTLTLPVVLYAPAFYTVTLNGATTGEFMHASGQLVSSTNPASPGEVILGFADGLGTTHPVIADGANPGTSPNTDATITATVGGSPATVLFAGLVQIGTYQVNFVVPAGLSGNQTVIMKANGVPSPGVTLPVANTLSIMVGSDLGTVSIGEVQTALTASGGNGTFAWALVSGTLPPGLALRTDVPASFPSGTGAGLIGVATTPGTYNFTLSVTSGGQTASQAFKLKVTGFVGKENTGYRLPDAFVGTVFTYTFGASNNAGTVTYGSPSGLPGGLTLSSAGVLTGTPTTAGYYTFTFTINDTVDTVTVSAAVNVSAVQVTSAGLLPNATQGSYYTTTLTAGGGTPPYTFSSGNLPSGLTLNSSTGVISGTVTASPGRSYFSVTATDHNSVAYTQSAAIVVTGAPPTLPWINTYGNFDDCTIGITCSRGLGAINGGTAPFTWVVTGLPAGMSFRSGSGVTSSSIIPADVELWGAPLATGSFNVQAQVTDAGGKAATQTFVLRVGSLYVDGNDYLPGGTRGSAYSKSLRVIGGTPATAAPLYAAQVNFGVLPAGLSLSGLTVSGTPLENGTFNPQFVFTDSATPANTLHIAESFGIGGGTSTIGANQYQFGNTGSYNNIIGYYTVGSTVSFQLGACCASAYTWSKTGGTLPNGISLSSGGLLSGTATTAGTFNFLVQVADSGNSANYGVRQYTIVVSALNITTGGTLPFGNVGTAYSTQLSPSIASTFSLLPGYYLAPGLSLNSSGLISGTPTTTGQYTFFVSAVDAANDVFLKQFSVSIYAAGTYPPLFLGTGPNLGTLSLGTHNFQLTASGGNPPYHYSLTPGAPTVPGYRVQDGQPLGTSFTVSGGTGGFFGLLTTPGSWNTSLRVTDASGTTFDRAVSITATSLHVVNPGSPPNATKNSPYSFTFKGYGGTGTYTWSASNLPAGLSINSTTGAISGTPTGSGSTATITITDSTPVSISANYTINVDAFAITTNGILPQGTINVAYSQTLAASGCGTSCAWTVSNGLLPSGLALGPTTGAITGTPTGFSNSTFTVQASGSNGTVQKRFSLLVPFNTPQPLFIGNASTIGYASVGSQSNLSLTAQGGAPPYTWSVPAGSTLPPGITLQTSGETLGSLYNPGFTYLAGRVMQAGSGPNASYTFTLQVTDAASNTATQTFTFIAPLMALNTGTWPIANPTAGTYAATYPALVYDTPYTQPQIISGGSGNYTSWTTPLASNPLPPGLTVDSYTGVISGTPANTGSFSTLMVVTDDAGDVLQQYVTFNVAANTTATVTIGLGPNVGNYAAGGSNAFNINPSGGTGPYTITALSALPPGCAIQSGSALLSNGTGSYDLTCSYLAAGTYSFTLQAQDSVGNIGVKTLTINVTPFILYSSTSLPNGSVGTAYSEQVLAFDNTAAVTWSVPASSTLPPGLNLSGSTLTGTPTQAGSYSFALIAGDGSGPTISYTFSLVISPLAITTPDIIPLQAIVNSPYTFTFAATGGGTLSWSATGLPSGLSLSSKGILSGTPTSAGTSRLTVTVSDGVSTYVHPFTLFARYNDPTIPTIPVLSTALSDARVGQSVSYTLSPSGGVPPFTWSVPSGSTLPAGLNLISGTSLSAYLSTQTVGLTYLAGTPSAAGSYTFDLLATDSAHTPTRWTFTLHVSPMTIVSGSLKTAVTGVAYAQQLTAAGGTPPYSFTYAPTSLGNLDMLPPGMTASDSGLISGTTASTGTYSFAVTAHDNLGQSFTTTYTLTVTNASGLYVSTSMATGVRLGRNTNTTLGTNGTSTYTWSVSAGALPSGIALMPSGSATVLAGAPQATGSFTFTLRATDNANQSNYAERIYTLPVQPMQGITNQVTSLPTGYIGSAYTYTLHVAGGAPPYTFGTTPLSPLPPGLSLSADGVVSGTPSTSGSYTFTYVVTDASLATGYVTTPTLNIVAAGAVPPLQGGSNSFSPSVGNPYAVPLDNYASGGVPPFTWSVASGSSLPPGWSILPGGNGVSSYLAGIPAAAGTSTFTLNVSDAAGQSGTEIVTLNISPIVTVPWVAPNGVVGTPYTATFTAAGGTAPYTFALSSSSNLPPGLTLSSTGSTVTLAGIPTSAGVFPVTLYVTDQAGNSLTGSRTVVVDNNGQSPGIGAPDVAHLSYVLGSPSPSPISVNLSATTGAIPFTAMVGGIPGATLTPTTGSAPAGLSLTLDPAALSAGTYVGVLAFRAPLAANGYTWIPIMLTVWPAPPCTYSLDSAGVTVPANRAYNSSFNVLAGGSCPWTASASDTSWITVSGGGPGGAPVSYSLAPNTNTSQRTGAINIVSNGQTVQSFPITEFGLSCSYGISPSVVGNLSPVATTITVDVTVSASGCPAWTATGAGAPTDSYTGNGSVTLSIPVNNSNQPQTTTATVAGQPFSATQNPATCIVALSSYAVQVPAAGSGASPYAVGIAIPTGCSYTSSASSGVAIQSGGSGTGPTTLYYSVAPNSTTVTQNLAIHIGGATLSITQAPLACSVTVDASGVGGTLGVGGGEPFPILVTANGNNCSWTASSPVSWATVSPPSGKGSGTVNVTLTSNAASATSRTTDPPLNIAGNNVSITQAGTTCTWQLTSPSGTVPYSGGSGTASVVAPGACNWSGQSNDADWLHVISSGSAGSSGVLFVADANTSSIARTGAIAIAGASPALAYTVTQAPAPCSYSLPVTASGSVDSGSYSGSFTFTTATAGCSPTPQSYAGWLHVANVAFSGGSGTLNFTADLNPDGSTRTGLIKLEDGSTYSVAQSGASCAFSLDAYSMAFSTLGGTGAVSGSPSAAGCRPSVGTQQPSMVTIGNLSGPTLNIFTLPYTVAPFVSAVAGTRKANITFGGKVYAIKQTSW